MEINSTEGRGGGERQATQKGVCGKRCFASLKEARLQMLVRWREGTKTRGSIYWCGRCRAFHHTRQAPTGSENFL